MALVDIQQGEAVTAEGGILIARNAVSKGHKIAWRDIHAGESVVKYGVPIGKASSEIKQGDHVHIHNVLDITDELCTAYASAFRQRGGGEK